MSDLLYLKSDFRDYYDHCFARSTAPFDKQGAVFTRNAHDGAMDKRRQFALLTDLGYTVPTHGTLEDCLHLLPKDTPLVVYTDPQAHQGRGKVLVPTREEAQRYDPYLYAAAYIVPGPLWHSRRSPVSRLHACSQRDLSIGFTRITLEYQSDDAWRSNCGDVAIQILYGPQACSRLNARCASDPYPLFAIDSVVGADGLTYAVDFNSAPQLKGTGLEHIMSAREVYANLEHYHLAYRRTLETRKAR